MSLLHSARPIAKLCDFGLARMRSELCVGLMRGSTAALLQSLRAPVDLGSGFQYDVGYDKIVGYIRILLILIITSQRWVLTWGGIAQVWSFWSGLINSIRISCGGTQADGMRG